MFPYVITKMSNFAEKSQIVPLCVLPGENNFDPGDSHL